ncbi:cysteine proteinase, partial [Metschnikowia bicuspidata var. bicuspidata NRRL YB-4993]
FPYQPTAVPQQRLRALAYKTSNRILDDMRLTPMFAAGRGERDVASLLNSRPIAYKHTVARLARRPAPTCLVLNDPLAHAPAVQKTQHAQHGVAVCVVRGLVVDTRAGTVAGHFKVQILDAAPRGPVAEKIQYHVVPRAMVSVDDLSLLADAATRGGRVLDDAFFKALGSAAHHMMRVSVYAPEFLPGDLAPLSDPAAVRRRYLDHLDRHPGSPLLRDAVPGPVHCFHTLLKVLKGPVLLAPDEPTHTISRAKTGLDAKLDVDLLFRALGFTRGADPDSLVPPNLCLPANAPMKESYMRKATELVFLGKALPLPGRANDFDVRFSFSDNLSQVHALLAEVDKHASLTMAWDDDSNCHPDYVALSAYAYFQDELVIRCYENTVNSDPHNKMHYVDSFAQLLLLRAHSGSARLRSYYTNQFLKGLMYGLSDYRNALRTLGIAGLADDAVVDDDAILEVYKAACRLDPKNYTYFNKQLRTVCAIKESTSIKDFIRAELVPQAVALDELRIEDLTEDEVVVTAYEFRLDEVMQSVNFNADSPEVLFLQKCLLSMAVVRKSYILMSYIDVHMPAFLAPSKALGADEAAALLGVDGSTNDFDIISNFQEKLMNSSYGDDIDIRLLRAALEILARQRASEILLSFLKSGKIDESLLPAENWPTGLDNIGNTCYLNSLLQYYFSIKPLREFILNFDEKNVDLLKLCSRKIGGRLVEESEGARSIQFIYRLQELFKEMIFTEKRYIQPSKELVYLSFLPLSQLVTFEDQDLTLNSDTEMEECSGEMSGEEGETSVSASLSEPKPLQLTSQTANSDLIDMCSLETEDNKLPERTNTLDRNEDQVQTRIMKIGSEQIESAIEIGRQQDVTECIENVTFQIETALEPEYLEEDGEQYDLIKRLFSGRTKQTITPLEQEKAPRVSSERFFSLIINVGDHPRDIYDALDNYFGENVVKLEEGKVKMSATILKTPEILQFHVQRVLFDREKIMAYKSLEVIPFGENIYLDRYLDTEDSEVLSKRQEVFEWKTEISKLHEEKQDILQVDSDTKLSVIDSLKSTLKYLNVKVLEQEELVIKQETIAVIQHQIELLNIRLQSINTRIDNLQQKISEQFKSYKKFGYTLFAVFIHRGEASYGHYWVYIKDPKRNIYRKYNDDSVTEVPASEVFNFTETNTATPYYMVFVKDELINEYIEPLKRIIKC